VGEREGGDAFISMTVTYIMEALRHVLNSFRPSSSFPPFPPSLPSKMPPTTSMITRGCFRNLVPRERNRVTQIMMTA